MFKPFGNTSARNVLQDCSTKCSNVIIKTDINSLSDYYYIFQKLIDHIPGMWRSTKYAKVIENEKHQNAHSHRGERTQMGHVPNWTRAITKKGVLLSKQKK